MQVKELIEILKEYSPKAKVIFHTAERTDLELLSTYGDREAEKESKTCHIDIGVDGE